MPIVEELTRWIPDSSAIQLCQDYMTLDFCSLCNSLFPKSFGCKTHVLEKTYLFQAPITIKHPLITCASENDAEVLTYLGPLAKNNTNIDGSYNSVSIIYTNAQVFLQLTPELKIELQEKLKNLKFIHITKTGGTSIEEWGKRRGFAWGRQHTDYGAWCKDSPGKGIWHSFFPLQASWLRLSYDWFLIVRNPYDRILSEAYCPFAGRDRPKRVENTDIAKQQFNAYIQRKINARFKYGDHYSEQHLYMAPGVHVLHFENLKVEFGLLMTKYQLPNVLDVHINRTAGTKEPKFAVDDFSQDTLCLINQVYKKDFSLFGYQQK